MARIDSTFEDVLRGKSKFNDYAVADLTINMAHSTDSESYLPVTGEVCLHRADGDDYYMSGYFGDEPVTPDAAECDIYFMTASSGPKLLNLTTGAIDTLSNPDYTSDAIKNTYRWRAVTVPYGETVSIQRDEMNAALHQIAVDTGAATEYEVNASYGARLDSAVAPGAVSLSGARPILDLKYPVHSYNAVLVYIKAKEG